MAEPIEFSRMVAVADLGVAGRTFSIEANAAERAALACRLGLDALHTLRADGVIAPCGGGGVRLRGRLQGEVVQTCVVSLEPFTASIDAPFESVYRPLPADAKDAERHGAGKAEVDDVDADDFCEPLDGDSIDVGEAVTQHLALELDPYPRKPGAVLAVAGDVSDAQTPETDASPFASLRARAGNEGPAQH